MLLPKKLGNAGDTIVEVLIAVVVVSSVLTGAFTISNMSLKSIRMSQERSEAQKLAQQSVEALGAVVKTGPAAVVAGEFCIIKDPSGNNIATVYTDDDCLDTTSGRYRTKITASGTTYKVRMNWDGLNGINQELIYYYRIAS